MPGTFVFRPMEANIKQKTELLTKINPYCCIVLGDQKFNSKTSINKDGQHPIWKDAIDIPVTNESSLLIKVVDKDNTVAEDLLGTATIDLKNIRSSAPSQNWFPLLYKNKPAGEILLETSFEDGNLRKPLKDDYLKSGAQSSTQTTSQYSAKYEIQSDLKSGNQFGNQSGAQFDNQSGMRSGAQFGAQSGLQSNIQSGFQSGAQFSDSRFTEKNSEFSSSNNQKLDKQTNRKIFCEQHETVQPHTFTKNIETCDMVPSQREIEVMEPRKVQKEVEYTEIVPVKRMLEAVEPTVVMREIEVIESRVVSKTIQVVESVPVKKMVEVVEMKHVNKEVETFEPRTFKKMIEVTEHVPVKKMVTVSEPMFHTEAVEFTEPVITTQTITKEIREPVIISQKTTQEVGAATLVHSQQQSRILRGEREYAGEEQWSSNKERQDEWALRERKLGEEQWSSNKERREDKHKTPEDHFKEGYLKQGAKKILGEERTERLQEKFDDIKKEFPVLGENSSSSNKAGNFKESSAKTEKGQKTSYSKDEKLISGKRDQEGVAGKFESNLKGSQANDDKLAGGKKESEGIASKLENLVKDGQAKVEKLISGKKDQEGQGKNAPSGSKP